MFNFAEEENKILKFWEKNKIFEKSLEQTKDKKTYKDLLNWIMAICTLVLAIQLVPVFLFA